MKISRVEDTHFPVNRYLRVRDKLVDLSVPKIMGIVNLTPDSFHPESRVSNEKDLIIKVSNMVEDGADIIDLGAYSTRPGAGEVDEHEEKRRIHPAIKVLKKEFPNLIISLDTFRTETAKIGIQEGVDIINDVSGGKLGENMFEVVGKAGVAYVLMHMRGTPQTMTELTEYEDGVFNEMIRYFSKAVQELNSHGCKDIIIDPGFGFSKTLEQNHELLHQLSQFKLLGLPLLTGISRKSMIYKKLNITQEDALNGTTVLNTVAILKGSSFLRVHDVKEARQIISLLY
jgi:dihydropteroate synthase